MAAHEPTLTVYMHPLSSYCWKVLIALDEAQTPFSIQMIEGHPSANETFRSLWPIAKMPLLRDSARDRVLPEATIIIEYLHQHCPGAACLIPADPDAQVEVRLWDRLFDLYVHTPVQKQVGDRLRPPEQKDPAGVADARATLDTAYGLLDERMRSREWAAGSAFTMADCAAFPPLFYGAAVQPYASRYPALARYFERLLTRPSVQRAIDGARPYFHFFPMHEALEPRFTRSASR
jgi:glutathione S-transferase